MPMFIISLAVEEDAQQVADELQRVAPSLVTIISVTHDNKAGGSVVFECSDEVALEINKIKPH